MEMKAMESIILNTTINSGWNIWGRISVIFETLLYQFVLFVQFRKF